MRDAPRILGVLMCLAVCACDPGPGSDTAAAHGTNPSGANSADRPNVLFIVWDTVRADLLGPYGHDRPTTPALDRFAAEGVVYERAVSPGIWTIPSHSSMFTGLPVSAHGASSMHKWLDQRYGTLAERLRDEAGYSTFAFSANPFVSTRNNLLQGFDVRNQAWQEPWAAKIAETTRAKLSPADQSLPKQDMEKDAAPVAVDELLRWVDSRVDDGPFFAFLNFMEAHDPRVPSTAAREQVMSPDQIARSYQVDQSQKAQLGAMFGKHDYSDDETEVIGLIYEACLVDLDRETGRLLDGLRERGLLDDTLVILTSDHGENLGDHGMFSHKFCVYDTLVRVPMIVRHPASLPAGRETRPISTRAVYSTVLQAAGLPRTSSDPRSLQEWAAHPEPDEPAFAELVASTPSALKSHLPEDRWHPWLRTYQSVEKDGHKLIRSSDGALQLYDVRTDPGELRDRSTTDPDRVRRMVELLDRWLQSFPAYDPALAGPDDRERSLSPEMRARLEALGYMQGSR